MGILTLDVESDPRNEILYCLRRAKTAQGDLLLLTPSQIRAMRLFITFREQTKSTPTLR